MTKLNYSLVIEATDNPNFFGFYSPDLEGFSGTGTSVDNCLHEAPVAMDEFVRILIEQGLPVPPPNPNPVVTVENSNRVIPAA